MAPSPAYRLGAQEFPNDNPLCDAGGLWIGSFLCEAPPAPAPLASAALVEAGRVEAAPLGSAASLASAALVEPTGLLEPPEDPVATFVRAVIEVAVAHGAKENAANIGSLFDLESRPACDFSREAKIALMEANILEPTDAGFRPTAEFALTSGAWQGLLRGESGDLSACGDQTLDGWTANLVARLVAKPDAAASIRRDLRRRGIAAYGMV